MTYFQILSNLLLFIIIIKIALSCIFLRLCVLNLTNSELNVSNYNYQNGSGKYSFYQGESQESSEVKIYTPGGSSIEILTWSGKDPLKVLSDASPGFYLFDVLNASGKIKRTMTFVKGRP